MHYTEPGQTLDEPKQNKEVKERKKMSGESNQSRFGQTANTDYFEFFFPIELLLKTNGKIGSQFSGDSNHQKKKVLTL
jgi:hypothetical protein